MSKFKKSFNNPFSFSEYSNDPTQMFDYTMTNLMDNFYDSAMNNETDGTFKAVVLSGMTTEDNTGAGTDPNDGSLQGKFIFLVVRPLTSFGNMIPDPRDAETPDQINRIITLHQSTFYARSDFEFTDQSPIQFGQIINCYFEKGSISNSNFSGLRFQEPKGLVVDDTFVVLGAKEGVESTRSAFVAGNTYLMGSFAGPLGPSPPINQTLLDTTKNITNAPWQVPGAILPVDDSNGSVKIGSTFGMRPNPNKDKRPEPSYHRGWDFPASKGTPFVALFDGEVIKAGPSTRSSANYPVRFDPEVQKEVGGVYGLLVEIKYNVKTVDGTDVELIVGYGHCQDIYTGIAPGVKVKQGQAVSTCGNRVAGKSSFGYHLHMYVKLKGRGMHNDLVDPVELFGWWDCRYPKSGSWKKRYPKFLQLHSELINDPKNSKPYPKFPDYR